MIDMITTHHADHFILGIVQCVTSLPLSSLITVVGPPNCSHKGSIFRLQQLKHCILLLLPWEQACRSKIPVVEVVC